ncbi:MAG: hypothetical protein AAF657_01515 [Acidobacteriota bacterium]
MDADIKNPSRADSIPSGLTLVRDGTDPAKRRRRLIFVSLYTLVAVLLVWPIFPLFSGIEPLILGLPLSFAWVVLALSIMFGALIWLYRTDDHDESSEH